MVVVPDMKTMPKWARFSCVSCCGRWGDPGHKKSAQMGACCGQFVHIVVMSGTFIMTWCRVVVVVGRFVSVVM